MVFSTLLATDENNLKAAYYTAPETISNTEPYQTIPLTMPKSPIHLHNRHLPFMRVAQDGRLKGNESQMKGKMSFGKEIYGVSY